MDRPQVAHFTVVATMEQSIRWKQVAQAAGRQVGTWIAEAADAYIAGTAPKPTTPPEYFTTLRTWHRGQFLVLLAAGREVEVEGMTSHPFGYFKGSATGPSAVAGRVLVHLPTRRMIGSARTTRQIRDMAAELEPAYVRDEAAAVLRFGEGQDGTRGEEVGMA
jgi:hypothetical protein